MRREIYEVHAKIVDANGTYNSLADYPKLFDSKNYGNDIDKTLQRARGSWHAALDAMALVDTRQVQEAYIIRVSDGLQIELERIGKLAELWDKYPHYRFGQLLKHVVSELHGNLYFIPDGVVLKNLQRFLDTGFAGVDRKESTDNNMANKKLSVRWQLEQEKLAKEKEGK